MKSFYTVLLVFTIHYNLMAEWILQSSGTTKHLYSVHFVNQDIGFVVGYQGTILKTSNGGIDWTMLSSGTTWPLTSVFFTNPSNGWAVGMNGLILHTTDGGVQWSDQNVPIYGLNEVFFIDSINGWIGADAGGIFHTTDGGNSWILQSTGNSTVISSVYFVNTNLGWAVGLLGKLIHTTNGGIEWLPQTSGVTESLSSIYFKDNFNGWIVGGGGTILHTTNSGIDWLSQTNGTSASLYDVQFTSLYNGWSVGSSGRIFHTSDGGNNWLLDFDAGLNSFYSISFVDSLNGWAVGYEGSICKYGTEGIEINWCNLQWPPEHTMNINQSVEIFARVFVDSITNPPGPGYGISAWIGYSTENINPSIWENWIQVEFNVDAGANDEYSGYLSGLDSGTYYYASRFQIYGGEYYYGGYPNGFWNGINNISGILYVFPFQVIEWCNLAGPPTHSMTVDDSVEIFAQVFVDGVTNVLGQGEGILSWIGINSANSDPATWTNWIPAEYNQDIGGNDQYSQYLSSLDSGTYYYASRFQIDGNNFYYGGYPDGFWNGTTKVSGVLAVTPIVNVDENKPREFSYVLYQNYPNPFNPSTTIRYNIPERSFVTIKIYDVLVNEVATLVSEEKPAGDYEVEFNGSNLPSGIYFYQLKAGSFVETKKMVLMK